MSLSAPAATSENKLPEVATDEELKAFFSSTKRGLFRSEEEEVSMNLDALKAVFAAPSPPAKAKVATDKMTTANGDFSYVTPELGARIGSIRLETEEENEERQRADELHHNVAIRRANLSFQRDMHPLLIRATCARFLRDAEVLKRKIAEAVAGKDQNVFMDQIGATLEGVREKLALLMAETNGQKLPSPAELSAQMQQVLGTLAETFGITDLSH